MEEIEVDVLVVGSGAGGLTAALCAHELGARTLIVEKSDKFGGTSATSGGAAWIPCNHLMAEFEQTDSPEAALEYMAACTEGVVDQIQLEAFVEEAPQMLSFMEERTHVRFTSTAYADYFPDLPGGKLGHRTLDPVPLDAADLGTELANLREPHPQTIFGNCTITIPEAQKIITRERGWQFIIARQLVSYWLDIPMRLRTSRHRRLTGGNALIGRCLKSVIECKIAAWRNAGLTSLITEDGRVSGAVVERDGAKINVRAAKGVILAAGGFESNPEMRSSYLPNPTDTQWSGTPGTNVGDAHRAAQSVGAELSLMEGAWWAPSVRVPGSDRATVLFAERALPGVYIVNSAGERFLNEAASYDVVGRQLQAHPNDSWVIFDGRVRKKYAIGPLLPTQVMPDKKWTTSIAQIVKKAATIEELANETGINEQGLRKTVEKVRRFAADGIDRDFNKGGNAYDLYYGDRTIHPNPCLAPIESAPFYAFPVKPGDIGTKGGIDVNRYAQALGANEQPILGLYAIGNCSSSVMGHSYPGAGGTLGPAMTFGYVAAKHMMCANA